MKEVDGDVAGDWGKGAEARDKSNQVKGSCTAIPGDETFVQILCTGQA
jgi:hypothetical protein